MNRGELLTRLTIWIALIGYLFGATGSIFLQQRPELAARVRWVWTISCLFFVAHVVSAFSYYHHWSHAAAYAETARQTAELFRRPWGEGVYISYFFTIAWIADVGWWWISAERYRRRPRRFSLALHVFFWFIVFNSTVVFETGPVRWLGLAITASMVLCHIILCARARVAVRSRELSLRSQEPH